MVLPTITDEVQRFDFKHETKQDPSINPLTFELLENSNSSTSDFKLLKV